MSGRPLTASLILSETPIVEMVELAREFEAHGFERIWLGEAWREPVVPITAIGLGTRRIGVGTAVSQIFPVNPVVVAQQAAQLQEVCGGRFALGLGLGAGFVVERWFGVDPSRPLRRAREFIEIVRGVLRSPEEGPFSYDGELLRTRKYKLPFTAEPVDLKINLAAVGPKMQELAGELGDGIVIGSLHSDQYMAATRERLAAGAARSGRDPEEIDIWFSLTCCVDPDPEVARRQARRSLVYVAQYAHYQRVYESEGYGEIVEKIAELVREREMDAAEKLVSDEMVEHFCLAGTPDECRAQLSRFEYGGATPILNLIPFRASEEEVVESLRLAATLAD
ncbi:MAG TPA: LLM class flavin-dependent oxidoreductase [Solirubrobacterales bacterium]|nr:LLM class flavin-dependent oxidoreductase [Solirubrobacterales bacterium]